ncbi:helix-turn-helix transcriptional regulator [Pararhizobium capsulatum]
MAAEAWLLQTCATLLVQQSTIRPGIPASVRHARILIDDDPTAPISLSDLAEASGLSRYQVLRAFSQWMGLTPHAYIVQRRLNMARRFIGTGMPLADAAAASGFSDQSHMTRLFTRFFGFSPGMLAAGRR